MANFIDQLMSAWQAAPSFGTAPIPGNPALGVPGGPGSPSGPPGMRDPTALQDTPARKMLMDAIAKAKAAGGAMGTVGNVASNAERISQAIGPAPSPAGSAQAAPGPAPLPSVPGVSIGQGPMQQAPLQALSNLMPPSGPPAAPAAPGSVPPIPMPKRFAEPIAPPAPAVGAWQTEVKKPETGGITAGNVQQFLRDWAAGAAGNTKSPVGAFFTGAHGSFESQAGREKTAAATEEKTFQRGLKTSQERRSEAKAKREARESDIKMQKLQAEIKKLVDPALGLKERGEILTRAMKYYNGLKDAPIDEEQKRKLLKDFVKQDETYMQKGALPTFGAADEPVKVSTPDEAMKLAPGTKFITPDGKVKVR